MKRSAREKLTMIYLDNHASTMCDPRVAEIIRPYLTDLSAGNPSSTHSAGKIAQAALAKGRKQVAVLFGAKPEDVFFTASATEANNLAIIGAAMSARKSGKGNHIISTEIEHPSVLKPLNYLASLGFRVTLVQVDGNCHVNREQILEAVSEDTFLVSIMSANNEVGTIQPITEIFPFIQPHIITHTDASQSAGRIPLNLTNSRVNLITLAGHKMHGPKGIGALCRTSHTLLEPQILGNQQEFGYRAGTQNVPGIVGLGVACEIYYKEGQSEQNYVTRLRDGLQQRLLGELDEVVINGDVSCRLPGNLHISFLGVQSDVLMKSLPSICVSSGAACTSGRGLPSHVLRAMGCSEKRAESSIRFGISRFNTEDEIQLACDLLVKAVKKIRN